MNLPITIPKLNSMMNILLLVTKSLNNEIMLLRRCDMRGWRDAGKLSEAEIL
jgi:hypothetical protein